MTKQTIQNGQIVRIWADDGYHICTVLWQGKGIFGSDIVQVRDLDSDYDYTVNAKSVEVY